MEENEIQNHENTHVHEHHDHEHPHDHGHHQHHHHEGEQAKDDPKKRLLALLNYMYSHNTDHTRELEDLAVKVKETGNDTAFKETMEAVSFFKSGNASLKKALESLGK